MRNLGSTLQKLNKLQILKTNDSINKVRETQSIINSQRDSHILDSTLHYNGVNDRLITESSDAANVHELGLTGGEKRKV